MSATGGFNPEDDDIWSDLGPADSPVPEPRRSGPRAPENPRRATPVGRPVPAQQMRSGRPESNSPRRWRPSVPVLLIAVVASAGAGWALSQYLFDSSEDRVDVAGPSEQQQVALSTTTIPPEVQPPPTESTDADGTEQETPDAEVTEPAPVPSPEPVVAPGPGARDWGAVVDALSPMTLPSDCGFPGGEPEHLPNAGREYRGGVHEGVDFICREMGRPAVAALDGRIVMANNTYVDPAPSDRVAVLDTARSLGRTPPWTLAMMFGRFVVIDHGHVPGAGHVVTIYAHLDEIDGAITPGLQVAAGHRLGEIGNRGTESAGTGENRPQAIHLHWEVHVDDVYLGAGASPSETENLYARLFGR